MLEKRISVIRRAADISSMPNLFAGMLSQTFLILEGSVFDSYSHFAGKETTSERLNGGTKRKWSPD